MQDYHDCEMDKQKVESEFSHYRDGHIPKHLSDTNELLVKTWRDDDKTFFETKGTQYIYNKVQNCNCVLVTSGSGSGKTAAIRHIALILQSRGFEILSLENPDEIIKYQTNQKQVFLIDDVLGKYDLNQDLLRQWESINEQLLVCLDARSGNKKILCTLRSHVALKRRFKSATTILTSCVINLDDKSIALSKQERQEILFMHLKVNNLDKAITTEEVHKVCESTYAFPLLCKLISNDVERFSLKCIFFKQPFSLLRDELDKMCTLNKTLYCVLILCMLYNGSLHKDFLGVYSREHDEKIYRIMQACGLHKHIPKTELYKSAHSALGTYFTYDSHNFKFIHDALDEAVACHFSRFDPKVMCTECDFRFITNRVHVYSNENMEEYVVSIREEELDHSDLIPLYQRILNELSKGKFYNVLMSQLLKNRKFVRIFASFINTNTTTSICKLVKTESSEMLDTKHRYSAKSRVFGAIGFRSTLMYWVVAFGCYEFFQFVWNELSIEAKRLFLRSDYLLFPYVKSFLPLAVMGGSMDIVSKLISDGPDVNCFSEFWETPLFIATRAGRRDMVDILLKDEAKVNLRGWLGMNVPILVTVNQPDLTPMLLEYDSKQTDIHVAVRQNDFKKLRTSIRSFNMNSKTESGWTPLHFAVALKNLQVVKKMFDDDFNGNDNSLGIETQRLLGNKKLKPNTNLPDNNGLTPIHLAIINDDVNTLSVLLRNEGDINVRDHYGRTPLHYTNSVRATEALLDHQRLLKITEVKSKSKILLCCYKMVLSRDPMSVFVNKQDKDGNTVLHTVTMNPFLKAERNDVIELLLKNGADPLLSNFTNKTATRLIKSNCDKPLHKHINQSLQDPCRKRAMLLKLVIIIIVPVMAVFLVFLTAIKQSESVFCATNHLGHFNNSGNNNTTTLLERRSKFMDVILTIIVFTKLSFMTGVKYSAVLTRAKRILIFTLGCIFFAFSRPFMSMANIRFPFLAICVASSCTLYTEFICCYYSAILTNLAYVKSFSIHQIPIIVLLGGAGLSVYAFCVDFTDNINQLVIHDANCSGVQKANITCVWLDDNITFRSNDEFLVKCNPVLNSTEGKDTLTIDYKNVSLYTYIIVMYYLVFPFGIYICTRIYTFTHFMNRPYLLRIAPFLPPFSVFIFSFLYTAIYYDEYTHFTVFCVSSITVFVLCVVSHVVVIGRKLLVYTPM